MGEFLPLACALRDDFPKFRTSKGAWLANAIRDEYGPPQGYEDAKADVKKTMREADEKAKETWRRADGEESVSDKAANLGDDIRNELGNAGDNIRRGAEDLHEDVEDKPV